MLLLPETPYFQEALMVARGLRSPAFVEGVSVGHANVTRRTQCDAQGNFVFERLPTARWRVLTEVRWDAGRIPQGGMLARSISVELQLDPVIMSDADRI